MLQRKSPLKKKRQEGREERVEGGSSHSKHSILWHQVLSLSARNAHHYLGHQLAVITAGQGWKKWDNNFLLSQCLFQKDWYDKAKPIFFQKQANSFISFVLYKGSLFYSHQSTISYLQIQNPKSSKKSLGRKLGPLSVLAVIYFTAKILTFVQGTAPDFTEMFYKI